LPAASVPPEHSSLLVLIVEDDPFIALDLEETLKKEGYYVLGPANTVASALALLEHTEPDLAVLDFTLGGKKVTPVAKVLFNHHVPFVMASGSTDPFGEEILDSATNLGKPTDKQALLEALEKLTAPTVS